MTFLMASCHHDLPLDMPIPKASFTDESCWCRDLKLYSSKQSNMQTYLRTNDPRQKATVILLVIFHDAIRNYWSYEKHLIGKLPIFDLYLRNCAISFPYNIRISPCKCRLFWYLSLDCILSKLDRIWVLHDPLSTLN